MKRQNSFVAAADIQYRELEPWWQCLESHAQLELYEKTNLDFQSYGHGIQINAGCKTKGFWELWSELHYRPEYFDDREVGDGTALQRTGVAGLEIEVQTDSRKPVSAAFFTQWQVSPISFHFEGEGGVTLRPLSMLEIELDPAGTYTKGEPRYYGEGANSHLFGRLEAASVSATLRATYTFMPQLSLQLYGQGFLAFGHYSDFSSYPALSTGPRRAIHLGDLIPSAGPGPINPDFESAAFNANVVVRWEYRLGSTLYFVYTHAQDVPEGPPRSGRGSLDFSLLSPRAAADVWLLKLSYWKG
jgi:hypothetical protein